MYANFLLLFALAQLLLAVVLAFYHALPRVDQALHQLQLRQVFLRRLRVMVVVVLVVVVLAVVLLAVVLVLV
jgi:fumarate reductase subunit D